MPFRLIRLRNLKVLKTFHCQKLRVQNSDCGTSCRFSMFINPFQRYGRKKAASSNFSPSCALPLVVAFILVFSVSQLMMMHRTIESYKERHKAFQDRYITGKWENGSSNGDNNITRESRLANDLRLSHKFAPIWPVGSDSSPLLSGSMLTRKSFSKLDGILAQPINQLWSGWSHTICEVVISKKNGSSQASVLASLEDEISLNAIALENEKFLQKGGSWTPKDCRPTFHVAIIIPYRDRWTHLKALVRILHPMLRRQRVSYQLFVAEQYGNNTFNKGALMNAGFLLAMTNSDSTFDCVIFHDVDLVPLDDRNMYTCQSSPAHLSVAIDIFGFRLPYVSLVGGVFALKVQHFILVNGYSNYYWGYGAEDDDMFQRLTANQLKVWRPDFTISKYKMLYHERRTANKNIGPLIRSAKRRFSADGLTTVKFKVISTTDNKVFTRFIIDIGEPPEVIKSSVDI